MGGIPFFSPPLNTSQIETSHKVGPLRWRASSSAVQVHRVIKGKEMIKHVHLSSGWMVVLALTLVVFLGAPGLVPDARAAEFNVLLQGPDMVLQNHNAELVVVVTDSQGRPAHGVPVVFRVAPGWENDVTLSPQSIVTQNGRARI